LVEIVSEPEISSSDEAYEYLSEVRKLVRYLDICDGNMEEGSLRCDANVSVMLKDATEFGERTETKNMHSLRNVKRAIDHEIKRQIDILEAGGKIPMETRSFNATDGSTFLLRSKEEAHDYRFFPEPDLQPVTIQQDYIDKIKANLPTLPNELFKKYTNDLKLSLYDAQIIVESKPFAIYFNELIQHTQNYKVAANWLIGTVKSYLNENATTIENFVITPQKLADLITLINSGKVSNSVAEKNIFPLLIKNPNLSPLDVAEQNNLIQESGADAIEGYINQVFEENPNEVERYKNGEKQLTGFLMGQLMKLSKGKADPKKSSKLLREMLEQ